MLLVSVEGLHNTGPGSFGWGDSLFLFVKELSLGNLAEHSMGFLVIAFVASGKTKMNLISVEFGEFGGRTGMSLEHHCCDERGN